MTVGELGTLLEATGIPTAFGDLEPGTATPAIVYSSPGTDNFMADDTVWLVINKVTIQLYTQYRSFDKEALVENVLSKLGGWNKYVQKINDENVYEITYELEVL